MRTTSPLLALQQARRHLLEHGHCPSGVVDERLARSWRRSVAAGLAPTGRAMADLPSPGDLRQAMARPVGARPAAMLRPQERARRSSTRPVGQ